MIIHFGNFSTENEKEYHLKMMKKKNEEEKIMSNLKFSLVELKIL
jgi:hypothetical protein